MLEVSDLWGVSAAHDYIRPHFGAVQFFNDMISSVLISLTRRGGGAVSERGSKLVKMGLYRKDTAELFFQCVLVFKANRVGVNLALHLSGGPVKLSSMY